MRGYLGIAALSASLFFMLSCLQRPKHNDLEKWKEEIRLAEQAFADMASSEGIGPAFTHFADEQAVLERNDKLFIGKEAIADLFRRNQASMANATLSWTPDFVDVASSGDLGYTYGKYRFTQMNENGKAQVSEGVFHTVWKRQKDGSWKFVWD